MKFVFEGEPYTESEEDKAASLRFMDFENGMYFDPIYHGKWPDSLVNGVGDRLPPLTAKDVELIKGNSSFDDIFYFPPKRFTLSTHQNSTKGGVPFLGFSGRFPDLQNAIMFFSLVPIEFRKVC